MMEQSKAKPLYVSGSVLLVLIPSTVALLLLYYVVPALLERTGSPFLLGYLPWWIGFMTLYFIVSIVAYRLEGNELSWKAFAERFRLKKVRGKDWWWLAALMVSFLIVGITLALLGDRLSAIPFLAPPSFFPPELDPSSPGGLIPGEFMGMPLAGRWWIPLVYFFGWILNILGEEFWFRGYMLPRQELAYGTRAWILHAVVWAIQHIWQGWSLVILLPYSFLWSYIIQRGRNTTIPIIVHGLGNLSALILILVGVMG